MPTLTRRRARLLSARTCPSVLLPTLPAWWPVDASSAAERDETRRARQLREACSGPVDGTSRELHFTREDGPPRTLEPVDGYTYELDDSSDVLVYRYSPQLSAKHALTMRAVESAFVEYGETRALRALNEGHVE